MKPENKIHYCWVDNLKEDSSIKSNNLEQLLSTVLSRTEKSLDVYYNHLTSV